MKRHVILALAALILDCGQGWSQSYPPTYREPNGRTWTCFARRSAW